MDDKSNKGQEDSKLTRHNAADVETRLRDALTAAAENRIRIQRGALGVRRGNDSLVLDEEIGAVDLLGALLLGTPLKDTEGLGLYSGAAHILGISLADVIDIMRGFDGSKTRETSLGYAIGRDLCREFIPTEVRNILSRRWSHTFSRTN